MDNPWKKPDATAASAEVELRPIRLGLGAVQFGLDYGIANTLGQTTLDDVRDILAAAADHGMRIIDTAPAYGDSEAVLGKALPPNHRYQIITKTPIFGTETIAQGDALRLRGYFEESLTRLGQESMYGLLVHHAEDLLAPGGERLMEAMTALKAAGKVGKIGVSVYSAGQIDNILARYEIDLMQLPVNLFDQRLTHSGHLRKIKARGIEIHARSVFLQGLLLMVPNDIPENLSAARSMVARLRRETARTGITPHQAALGFVKSIEEVDCIIVGVNSRRQLLDNITAFTAGADLPFKEYALADEQILNPSLWKTTPKN